MTYIFYIFIYKKKTREHKFVQQFSTIQEIQQTQQRKVHVTHFSFLCCFFADMLISHFFAGQLSLSLIFKTSTYCLVAISCIQYRINSEWTSRSNLKFLAPCEWECVGVFQRTKEKEVKMNRKRTKEKSCTIVKPPSWTTWTLAFSLSKTEQSTFEWMRG